MKKTILVLVLAALSYGCGADVLLVYRTEVLPDGTIARRVEAHGVAGEPPREPPREPRPKDAPEAPELLEADVASPEAWRDVRRRTEGIEIEGLFPTAADVPPAFVLGKPERRVRESDRLTLEVDDLLILDRWRYREVYADPYGPDQMAAALDRLVKLGWETIREEVRRELGEDVNTTRAEALALGPGRAVLGRIAAALVRDKDRSSIVRELERLELPVSPVTGEDFPVAELILLSRYARGRVATALSTADRPVTSEELSFWPVEEDGFWKRIDELFDRSPAGKEAADETVQSSLESLLGFYAGAGGRYRFRFRLALPGRPFRTNGALEEGAAGWFFRGDDITVDGRPMEAESIVLDDAALKRLSARRPEDAATLAEIVDALTTRDPDGLLKKLLAEAVERRSLSVLRNPPEGWQGPKDIAKELADLLS